MWLFGKNNTGWVITDNVNMIAYPIEKPALCFSYHPDMGGIKGTLHKFGEAARIEAYFKRTHKLYVESGLEKEAEELIYMDFEESFDVEELNKCIEITGYVALLYERSVSDALDKKEQRASVWSSN